MASAELPGIGKIDSEPVEYFWNPLYNVTGVVAWLFLAAGFVLFKENRCRQALWILVPVIVIKGLWAALAAAFSMPSSQTIVFAAMLDALLISFALIWILAERLSRFNRFVRLLLEFAVLLVVGGASISQLGGTESVIIAVLCIVVWSVILSAFSFGRFICRRRFGPVRFCLWSAIWILFVLPLLFIICAAIEMQSFTRMVQYIGQVLMVTAVFAGIMIIGLLPFEILLFKNAFWRRRFERLLGIQSRPAMAAVEPASE